MNSTSSSKTPEWQIALAWIFVGIPLVWGVIETLISALPLFQ